MAAHRTGMTLDRSNCLHPYPSSIHHSHHNFVHHSHHDSRCPATIATMTPTAMRHTAARRFLPLHTILHLTGQPDWVLGAQGHGMPLSRQEGQDAAPRYPPPILLPPSLLPLSPSSAPTPPQLSPNSVVNLSSRRMVFTASHHRRGKHLLYHRKSTKACETPVRESGQRTGRAGLTHRTQASQAWWSAPTHTRMCVAA